MCSNVTSVTFNIWDLVNSALFSFSKHFCNLFSCRIFGIIMALIGALSPFYHI